MFIIESFQIIDHNIYGVDLFTGRITPSNSHCAELFYIVDTTNNEEFIKREALQMLLQFGQTNYFFYGKQSKLWHLIFDETDIMLNSNKETVANTIDCSTLDELIDELKNRKHLRNIVNCDYYLIYDNEETFEFVKNEISK